MSAAPEALRQRAAAGEALALHQLGLWHAVRQHWPQALDHLSRADAAGHADAQAWLALHALYGWGGSADPARALALFEAAEARGSGEAMYQLAHLAWCDRLVRRDPARMIARLLSAAAADHPGALRALALVYACSSDQQAESDACLARAAALDDRLALYLLGRRWLARGDAGQRAAAHGLLALAAAMGLPRAAALHAPGSAPQRISAPRLATLPMPRSGGAAITTPQVHHEQPLVETFDDAWTEEECEYLIASAEPFLHRSVTVAADGRHVPHEDRTSSDASLLGVREDFIARWLQARMTDRLRVPLSHAEHLVVLRYLPGQEYRPHCDWLHPGTRGNLPGPEHPGQRVHTVFCYLNHVAEGGATDFPQLKVRVEPRRGRIVHFTNLRPDGSGDPATLHAGLPVVAGEKWLATLWTRVRACRAY
jgi:prolyl 4-hydroxylase